MPYCLLLIPNAIWSICFTKYQLALLGDIQGIFLTTYCQEFKRQPEQLHSAVVWTPTICSMYIGSPPIFGGRMNALRVQTLQTLSSL